MSDRKRTEPFQSDLSPIAARPRYGMIRADVEMMMMLLRNNAR